MVRTLDETKRTAILNAAKKIFVRDSVANSKMSDVASEAGVAPGTLYLYFENKDALVSAIGDDYFSHLVADLIEHIEKIEGPDDVIDLVDWADNVADQERALLAMATERGNAARRKTEGHKRKVDNVGGALQSLIERGIIRQYDDSSVLAELLLSLMRRLIMSRTMFGDEETEKLRAGAVVVIQRILFDDVAVTASQLVKRKTG